MVGAVRQDFNVVTWEEVSWGVGTLVSHDEVNTMRLPGFNAETSLYKTSRHYRIGVEFGLADETIHPALSINDLIKSSPDFYFKGRYDFVSNDFVSIRGCCKDCLSFPCADESCRRQRSFYCTSKCSAEGIGGCGCPPGRAVCEGLCCDPGDVCTLDGCSPPNQVCNNRGGCLGECLPDGCCPPGNVVCNNHCCKLGWSCTSEGCCPPGVCCESTACLPGKFCCGGKVCCRDGTDCKLVNGTSEYGCFRSIVRTKLDSDNAVRA